MKIQTRAIFFFLLASIIVLSGGRLRSAQSSENQSDTLKRIRFQIAAYEESAGQRSLISETTVEGPQGSDFNVELQGERFEMSANFLTDLVGPDVLKIRAKLKTRRLYGYSERNLPLYEEDNQQETLDLGFDEKIVLLPFGRNDSSEQLKIEITPTISLTPYFTSGKVRSLEIEFPKISPGGAIRVEALKLPHNFVIEATLLEDGREVARGEGGYLIQEPREIVLQPSDKAGSEVASNPLVVNLTVERFTRSREDLISFGFSAYRVDKQRGNQRVPVIAKGAGIGAIDSALSYGLGGRYLNSTGKRYELRFRVKLAPN